MQLLHEPVALVLVHDEGEIQIVGGLAHQVDLLLLEEFERIAQLVQDGANIAPHETDRGARTDDLYAAQPRQIGHQRAEQRVVQRVGGRIERYGDVSL